MADVPRNVERQIKSTAGVRGLDVIRIEHEEEQDGGDVYRVVINDEEAEEGENPAFFVLRPDEPGGMNMFGERLERKMSAVRKQLLGVEDETDYELEETRRELEERGHPGATGDDVEYGPGPRPNVEGVKGGYDDGQIRVRSTTDADFPEPEPSPDTSTEETTEPSQTTRQTNTLTQQQEQNMEITTDDVWGRIADAALDARELEEKGHEIAAKALLTEIQADIDEYMDESQE